MSQLFDALRRGRPQAASGAPRTAQGDAVLATLGYAPVRRPGRTRSAVVGVLVLLGALALIWSGWRLYTGRRPAPVSPAPTASPAAPSRPAVQNPATGIAASGTPPPRVAAPPVTSSPPAAVAPAGPPAPRGPGPGGEGMRSDPPPMRAPGPMPVTRAESGALVPSPAPAEAGDLELALYYHRAGDFENALQHYRALLQRNELNAQAHNNLGLLYQEKKLLTESARELARAVLIEPRNARAHNNYGVTLLLQGRADEAAARFRTALTLDPRNVDALVNLALAQRDGRQPEVAKETLLEALTMSPRSAPAHYNLAQLYDQTSEAARAVDHYRKFLEYSGTEYASRAAAVRARIEALSRTPE